MTIKHLIQNRRPCDSGTLWIGVVIVALIAGTAVLADDQTDRFPREYWDTHAGEKDVTWSEMELGFSEAEFDKAVSDLPNVTIDPPPEIGKNYNPTFPPDEPFNPDEWLTNASSPSIADPDAIPGGMLKYAIPSFPPTIRTEGPNSSLSTLSDIHGLIYERLLGYDSTIGDYVPGLASHWQIGEDRRTFRYRLNPKAKWADGRPVTTDDVVATLEHLRNPDRQAPTTNQYWNELIESVKIIDRHIVEIRVTEARWRNMLTISSGLPVYPAAYIRMDGETYLNEWNWQLPPGTGPYELRPEDIKQGRSITLRRRRDYWDEDNPEMKGVYNFDAIRMEVVRDSELMYQKLLAGELDLYVVGTAQRWIDEVDEEDVVNMGYVQKRRIWNRAPVGYGGYCLNMRIEPFNSRNVRLAFAHLFNREKLFSKYFYYQYEYIDSYFPGQEWARPNAEPIRFNADEARRLLQEDGWIRNSDGLLVREDTGEPFPELTLELSNANASSIRIHNLFKDELWREAGIKLDLKQIDAPSLLKKVWDQKFQLVYWFWSASRFPNPEYGFHSRFANQKQSSNLCGIALPEIDELVIEYKYEFDYGKRRKILQRIDELVFNEHPYVLAWYSPYFRLLYWDKFDHPEEYASKYGDDINNLVAYWWFDPDKARKTEQNQADGKPNYPGKDLNQYDEVEQDYWMHHDHPMGVTPPPPPASSALNDMPTPTPVSGADAFGDTPNDQSKSERSRP